MESQGMAGAAGLAAPAMAPRVSAVAGPDCPLVLVADDEAVVRTVLNSMLRRLGCEVILAADGREALEIYAASHGSIHLVIFDLFLPDMTGEQLYAQLLTINPQARTVLTTGNCEHAMLDDLLAAGVCGILPKPFDVAQLRAQVTTVLAG